MVNDPEWWENKDKVGSIAATIVILGLAGFIGVFFICIATLMLRAVF